MSNSNIQRLAGLVLAIWLVPGLAEAQKRVESFSDLNKVLKAGRVVEVTDNSGQKTIGKVAEILPSSLVILTKETNWTDRQTFSDADVAKIRGTQRLWDGPLRGLGVGLVIVALASRDCNGCGSGEDYATVGAIGAGIGLGFDAAIGPRTFYVSSASNRKVFVSQISNRDSRGLTLVVRF